MGLSKPLILQEVKGKQRKRMLVRESSMNCNSKQIKLMMAREAGMDTNSNLGSLSNSVNMRSQVIKKELLEFSQAQKIPLEFNVEVAELDAQGSQAIDPSMSENLITRLNSRALMSQNMLTL